MATRKKTTTSKRASRKPAAKKSLPPDLKVAIVHDWLIGGGAERVVEELHGMFPYAPIYTSYATKEWKKKLHGMVRTGVLQHWPFSRMRKFLPLLRIWWFSRLKLEGYDLIISSSGAEAKGVNVPEGTLHINYCHAPTHYYWSRYDEYMKRPGFGPFNALARLGLWLLVRPLRKWDYDAAQKPDFMIANSTHIQAEIKKYYGRESEVVFPPVDTERFLVSSKGPTPERFGFVITGRQTPYKRFDLAVAACSIANLPLKVIGDGPDHNRLAAMAGPSVRFLGYLSGDELVNHVQKAEAFLFPGLDDFGISPVEAMAAGTPVIAYKAGGALDYVEPAVTGEFFEEQTPESLTAALRQFNPEAYDHKKIAKKAGAFSKSKFDGIMTKVIIKYLARNSN